MMEESIHVQITICRAIVAEKDGALNWFKKFRFDECKFLIDNGYIEYELKKGHPRYGLFNITESGYQYYKALKQLREL